MNHQVIFFFFSSFINESLSHFFLLFWFGLKKFEIGETRERERETISFNEHPGRNLFRIGREEDQVVGIPPLSFLGSPIQIEVHGNERRDVPPLWPSWDRCHAHCQPFSRLVFFANILFWRRRRKEKIIFPA